MHYDEENWKLLAKALEENHEVFPAETRASLVDDVLGLAAVGLTSYATAFDFIKYMRTKERHYAPWGALMRHLLKLNGLLYETSGFRDFQVAPRPPLLRMKRASVLQVTERERERDEFSM